MTVQTIPYLDFATIVEAITDVSDAAYMLRATGQNRVEHALAVPNAGIGDMEYYPSMPEKAATLAYQIIQGHPLIDGNKRTKLVMCACWSYCTAMGIHGVDLQGMAKLAKKP